MAGASFKMDMSGLEKLMGKAVQKISASQELMETIGEVLVSGTKERFEAGEDPDGNAWKASRRAEDEGGQTLVNDGHLKSSINYEASPSTVAVGTSNEVYGAIHQFGGTIRPKSGKTLAFTVGGKKFFPKKVDIPARPYIGISEEDQAEARSMVEIFMREGFGL